MTTEESQKFWEEYQEKAWSTCLPSCQNADYLQLGLLSEVGELCGKMKKKIRGDYDNTPEQFLKDIKGEIGDILWYIASLRKFRNQPMYMMYLSGKIDVSDRNIVSITIGSLSSALMFVNDYSLMGLHKLTGALQLIVYFYGISIEEIALANLEKLSQRHQTGNIIGSGDYR